MRQGHRHRKPSLDELLEPLYASILAPERFEEFAAGLGRALDSHLVALQSDDPGHEHRVERHFEGRRAVPDFSGLADDARVNHYLLRGAGALLREGVFSSTGLFVPGELERTAFYREVLREVDVYHSLGFLLWSDGTGRLLGLSASRDRRRRPFGEEELHFGRRLLPHLKHVHALQQRLRALEGFREAIEHRHQATIVLDTEGCLLHASPAAEALVRTGNIKVGCGRISCAWGADRARLQRAIAAAVAGVPQDAGLLLHDRIGEPWAVCHVHATRCATLGAWPGAGRPGALVFLVPLGSRREIAPAALIDIFGFTRAEADLADALLRHGSLASCCEALGKSRETLRSQLKRLFDKTDTHRQADLILRLRSAV